MFIEKQAEGVHRASPHLAFENVGEEAAPRVPHPSQHHREGWEATNLALNTLAPKAQLAGSEFPRLDF
jgi:hypothetical protein